MSEDKKKSKSVMEVYKEAVAVLNEARNAHNAAAKAVKKAAQALEDKGK